MNPQENCLNDKKLVQEASCRKQNVKY